MGFTVAALIIRIGFEAIYYTIIVTKTPQKPILIVKAPTFGCFVKYTARKVSLRA